MIITPKKAAELLANNETNRHLSKRLVATYAADMKRGKWVNNGETIKIAKSGRLLDGQHRLQACVESNMPFETHIVYDIDDSAFDTIDVGKKRTVGDMLSIVGYTNPNKLAAAARWYMVIKKRAATANSFVMKADDAIRILEQNDQFVPSVTKTTAITIISPSALAAFHVCACEIDPDLADEFVDKIKTGAGMDIDDPVFTLREQLIKFKLAGPKSAVSDYEKIARCIRAWNATRRGVPVKQLKGMIQRDDGSYLMPELE